MRLLLLAALLYPTPPATNDHRRASATAKVPALVLDGSPTISIQFRTKTNWDREGHRHLPQRWATR